MDLRRKEASALFSPSSTSTSTTPSRKNSPRLHAPITAAHAYIIAGDKYGDTNDDKNDKNNVQITGVKDSEVLNVLSGSTGSEVEKNGEVEGEEAKVFKKSTVATVSPALSRAYSATSVDSDDDIISGGYSGGREGGGRGGVGGGGKGGGGHKGDTDDGIKAHGPTLLGSARSAQLHAMYTSSESKGDGKGKGKGRGEKKEEGKGERKEGKGEGKGDEKGEGVEEQEKGEGREEMKAQAKERGHTHDSNETDVVWLKSVNGIETKVIGGSHIFNNTHITQLEAVSYVIVELYLNILDLRFLFLLYFTYFLVVRKC